MSVCERICSIRKPSFVIGHLDATAELRALEGVASDEAGNVYGGYTNTLNFRRW
jgi:hypothetical protein